ncbi:MAG: hypothetical protein KGV46_02430 [Pasteurella sp.]|nr:hypothetical protein [Pasteurella sp.]
MKNFTLYRQPIFLTIIIGLVTFLMAMSWRLTIGISTHIYVDYENVLQSQAALVVAAIAWLLIFITVLKFKHTSVVGTGENTTFLQKLLLLIVSVLFSYVLWLSSYTLSRLSGYLFSFLCAYLIVLILLTAKHNRWFYYSAGVIGLILPIIQLLDSPYRMQRISDLLFGGSNTDIIYYPVKTNLDNSVLFGASPIDWIDMPAYHGQMLILKLIHIIGFVPALFLAFFALSIWVFMAVKIYCLKNMNKFWQSLAFYLSLFFIVEGIMNILGNVTVLKSVMSTNLMPFSSNAGLWVFFIAFGIAYWKIRNK